MNEEQINHSAINGHRYGIILETPPIPFYRISPDHGDPNYIFVLINAMGTPVWVKRLRDEIWIEN